MRRVLVQDKIQNIYFESYVLKSEEDLEEFRVLLNKCVKGLSIRFLKSTLPVGKLDHLVGTLRGMERALASLATLKLTDTNPLWELPLVAQKYFDGISKAIKLGDIVLLNDSAGWRTFNKDLKIVKNIQNVNLDLPDISIKNPSKYINIENDITLEPRAVKHLEKVDKNYSYITNLRALKDEGLFEYFHQFLDNGGTTLYVYTTGYDVKQAERFYDIAWRAGIPYYEIEMSEDITDDYYLILSKLKSRESVKGVKLVNVGQDKNTQRFARMLDES